MTGAVSEYTFNFYQPELPSPVPYDIDMSMDGAMHNHLTLNVTSFGGAIEITYDARDGVYDEAATRRFHDALLHLLTLGMDEPERPVGEYEIVGDAERAFLQNVKGREITISASATIPSLKH